MKPKLFLLAALALLCSSTLLTACGSDDDDNQPSEDKTRAYIAFDSFFFIEDDALDYLYIDITYDGETHRVEKKDLTSDGLYKITQIVPMSALPTTLKTIQVFTVRDDVDFPNEERLLFSMGHYYRYSYLNAAKAVIDNQYYEGGNTYTLVIEKRDDVRNVHGFVEYTYSFDKAGELLK